MNLLSALMAGAMLANGAQRTPDRPAEELFVRRIAPLLEQKCVACHGSDGAERKGGLDLRDRKGLLTGGDSGDPAVVPGQPDVSPLFLAVTRTSDDWSAMPPKQAEQLSPQQVDWIRDWIAAGAPWPNAARRRGILRRQVENWSAQDGVAVATSGGLSAEWTNRKYKPEGLWAYRPVKKPALAETDSRAIDALIDSRIPAGLVKAPPVDRVTLLRRATFDLTGLPPAPEEIEAFGADPLPDEQAFAKVVERLLASPHYGERMAQHWLDVVRYADSSGFANDFERGNAWRYRDYVVRAFNGDKPYDQFIREQIAGDEIDSSDPEKLVATGFLRMGPWELTGMEVAKVARQRFLDDVTNIVGETFLAHSLQCARCHDHKFDPVPTRDYYAIQAVFATTQLVERPAAFLRTENTAGFDEKRFLEQRRAEHLAILAELDRKALAAAEAWFADKDLDPSHWHAALAKAKKARFGSVFQQARGALLRQGISEDQIPPRMLGWTPQEIGLERIARKGLERLAWEQDRYEPFALAVYSGRTPTVSSVVAPVRMPADRRTAGEREETCLLLGGNPFAPGERVQPGILSVLAGVQKVAIPTTMEGRRRAFAEWVASPENPLTTRTIVNRVWLWHFGQPLAGHPNNFGSTGKRPTHPELLDWLAATFVETGWSFKTLHRLIMNSATYRRSTAHPDRKSLGAQDPTGTSYAAFRPRRLSAEELRDAMLAASGELNLMLGGIPNRPEINREAALQPRQVMGTFAAAWTPNPLPHQRQRRSLYALRWRGLVDPMLEVFNAPAPDFSCERRMSSTVTPQVFSLFNGQASHARALALAARVLSETNTRERAIEWSFLLALGRNPCPEELEACLAHWERMEALHAQAPPVRRPVPRQVRRDAIEENTGEKFSYDETLYAYAEFVPDLEAADVDLRTRGLAEVCLVLFNCNEFCYVY